MGLFDFLRPPPQSHPELGPLSYRGGHWHGVVALDGAARLPLHLPGPRSGPSPEALRLAGQASAWWAEVRERVTAELYAHYTAGRDGGLAAIPGVTEPSAVWSEVTLSSVQLAPYGSPREMQVALRVTWDEEHTLGALLRDGELVELNGSILEPR
jgi:hypothetical protein